MTGTTRDRKIDNKQKSLVQRTVVDQIELDEAVHDNVNLIVIDSNDHIVITKPSNCMSRFQLMGDTTATAHSDRGSELFVSTHESSHLEANGFTRVCAMGNSMTVLKDQADCSAYDSAKIDVHSPTATVWVIPGNTTVQVIH